MDILRDVIDSPGVHFVDQLETPRLIEDLTQSPPTKLKPSAADPSGSFHWFRRLELASNEIRHMLASGSLAVAEAAHIISDPLESSNTTSTTAPSSSMTQSSDFEMSLPFSGVTADNPLFKKSLSYVSAAVADAASHPTNQLLPEARVPMRIVPHMPLLEPSPPLLLAQSWQIVSGLCAGLRRLDLWLRRTLWLSPSYPLVPILAGSGGPRGMDVLRIQLHGAEPVTDSTPDKAPGRAAGRRPRPPRKGADLDKTVCDAYKELYDASYCVMGRRCFSFNKVCKRPLVYSMHFVGVCGSSFDWGAPCRS